MCHYCAKQLLRHCNSPSGKSFCARTHARTHAPRQKKITVWISLNFLSLKRCFSSPQRHPKLDSLPLQKASENPTNAHTLMHARAHTRINTLRTAYTAPAKGRFAWGWHFFQAHPNSPFLFQFFAGNFGRACRTPLCSSPDFRDS